MEYLLVQFDEQDKLPLRFWNGEMWVMNLNNSKKYTDFDTIIDLLGDHRVYLREPVYICYFKGKRFYKIILDEYEPLLVPNAFNI